MKQFKYFTSKDWSNYIGSYLYRKLKKRYGTNKAIATAFERDTDFQTCKAVTGLKVSDHMTGKMEGIKCIPSDCTVNEHCKSLHTNGICKHCYAFRYLNMRPTVRKCYEKSSNVLSNDMDVAYMPTFRKGDFVRLESFGDLINVEHIENYLLICFKNPQTNFALFTKRRFMLENYFKHFDVKKPKNLSIVSSAYTMNDDKNTELYASYETNDNLDFKLIDTVFNVYTNDENIQKKDRLALHTHECEKQCRFCLVCWHNTMSDLMLVKERLK